MYMKSLTLSIAGALLLGASPAPLKAADTDYGQVAMYVADMLQKHHYSREDFDDSVSARLLDTYLGYLDFSHQYFTGEDIEKFNKLYRDSLDDQILVGDVSAATAIYDTFEQRVKDRAAKIRKLLESEKFTFDSDRSVHVSRKDEPWPANEEAADKLWRNIIEGELLQEKLRLTAQEDEDEDEEKEDGKGDEDPANTDKATPDESADEPKEKVDEPEETPEQRILKRYTRFVESLDENTEEDVVNYFLTSLASAYDPHSDWFSQSELENFQISMKNSLFGIGALLQAKDDGTAEIQGLVLNGPAQQGGDLKVGDRIVGVGQGEDGEIEDTVYMRLQKVVEKIRGKKGSTVVLKVADPDDLSITRKVVIVRDEVQLKDKLATAQVIDTKNSQGQSTRFGWIELPAFYADMDERKTGATQDVAKLLDRLMTENIEGLILDLRGNGGGSLEEAISLTGLFIKRGPVVQAKDWRSKIDFRSSRARFPVYDGPLVVLTDKASASASEIVAAALQDYNRALVVGEKSTFGKGTVQTILQVAQYMPFFSEKKRAGALKVTIQKFYRVAGGSTQLRGVIPHIQLPSRRDALEIGEDALENPLPYDEIPAQQYEFAQESPPVNDEIRSRHLARISEEQEFQYILEDTARLKEQMDKNTVSLNEATRISEIEANKARRKAREEAREKHQEELHEANPDRYTIYRLTLDNVADAELVPEDKFTDVDSTGMILKEGRKPKNEFDEFPYHIDPVKRESLNILHDLVIFGNPTRTAKVDKVEGSS